MEKRVTFDSEVTAIARILFSAGEITDGKKTIRDDARYAEKRGEVVIERQQGQGESRPRLYVYRNGGCKNFCVNGQSAGNCHIARSDDDRSEESRTQGVAGQPAG